MTEHATLVPVATFPPADGCFGTKICTVDEQPEAMAVVSSWRDQGLNDDDCGDSLISHDVADGNGTLVGW